VIALVSPDLTAETTVETDVVAAIGVNERVKVPSAALDVVAVDVVGDVAGVFVPVAVTVAPLSLLPN